MAIPLFTGVADLGGGLAGVRPNTDVVSRLDPTLFGKGASDARFAPTTAGAIAEGVTQGVETYQRTELNNQAIEQNELSLQNQRELGPLQRQNEEARLQEQQAQLAEATKLRQRQDQLMGIFQQGTPEQKVAAVTSGEFADVFAKDPHLEQYAIKVAAPGMTDEEANAFLFTKQRQADRLRLEKNKEQLLNQFEKSEAGLLANSDVNQIFTQHPEFDGNLDRLTDSVTFERAGEFKRNAEGFMERGRDGKPVRDANFGTETGKETYHAIDKKTGKIVMPNLSVETRRELESYVANKTQLKKIDSYEGDRYIDTLKRARGIPASPDMSSQPRSRETAPQTQQVANPSTARGSMSATTPPPAKAPDTPVSVPEFSKVLQKVPAELEDGRISFQKSAALTNVAAKTLGVSPAVATTEKNTKALATVLDAQSQAQSGNLSADEKRLQSKMAADAKDTFIKTLLADEFKAKDSGLPSLYTAERVKQHNEQAGARMASIRAFAKGQINFVPGYAWDTVGSPEELYVRNNYDRVRTRLDSLARLTDEESRRRASEGVRKGTAMSQAAENLSRRIGS